MGTRGSALGSCDPPDEAAAGAGRLGVVCLAVAERSGHAPKAALYVERLLQQFGAADRPEIARARRVLRS